MGFELLRESTQVARKEHKCVWCGEIILKGEKYHSRTYIFEGLQSDKTHNDCNSVMNKIDWNYYDNGFYPYNFTRGTNKGKNGEEWMLRKGIEQESKE